MQMNLIIIPAHSLLQDIAAECHISSYSQKILRPQICNDSKDVLLTSKIFP